MNKFFLLLVVLLVAPGAYDPRQACIDAVTQMHNERFQTSRSPSTCAQSFNCTTRHQQDYSMCNSLPSNTGKSPTYK